MKMYCNIGWWETSASQFTQMFEMLDNKYEKIIIRVHSYGGQVMEGNAIYNCLDQRKSYVKIKVEGVCASMMTIIMLPVDEIEACDNALFMLHSPRGGSYGTVKDMQQTAKLLMLMEKNFAKNYSRKTQKQFDFKTYFDGTDHWMDSDEALSFGLIDKIIPPLVKDIKKLDKPQNAADASRVFNAFTAKLDPEQLPESLSKTDINMKKKLIEMFGLTGLTEDSSDTAIAEAIKAKMDGLNTRITDLETAQKDGVKAQAETLIAAVEKASGKAFEDKEKEQFLKIATASGLDALQTVLSYATPTAAAPKQETPKTPSIVNMMNKNSGTASADTGKDNWGWKEWQEKDPDGLEALAKNDYDKFNAIYKAEFKVDAPK